jgi:predicted DNA-binding transcriptional regulator YafY
VAGSLVTAGRWAGSSRGAGQGGQRNFRLDRITKVAPDGRRFRQRDLPAEDAAALVRQSISTAPMNHDVRAVLHCPAAAAQDRLGRWANIQELSGDRCLLSISTESLQWAAMALGSAGAEVTDVRPPQLAAVLRDWSDRFARAADLATAHG